MPPRTPEDKVVRPLHAASAALAAPRAARRAFSLYALWCTLTLCRAHRPRAGASARREDGTVVESVMCDVL